MAFAPKYRQFVEAVLAVVLTSVLFYFGNGLNPLWPLMWFAPLPVLVFALRSKGWATTVVAVAAMVVGSLNLWSYFTKALGAPGSVWVEIALASGIAFAAGVLLFRLLVLRGAVWSGLVALPAVWVTGEYVRNFVMPHGSAGSLAYSQLRFLPFLQFASITGPWGMTFVLLLFPVSIAIGLHLRRRSPKLTLQIAGAGIAVVAAVLVFGVVRLELPRTPMQTVKVGLIASDERANLWQAASGNDTERLLRDYASAAKTLTAKGAQAIVIPEKLGMTIEGKSAASDAVMQSLAEDTGATVIAGVVHVDAPVKYNEARIYVPGSSVQRYDKEHMLPPFESDLKPGTTLTLLPHPHQTWGVAICKDMDFAFPARLYGEAGAGLLLVPAWDFVVDASWHGHIAVMRGVEDGFSIARAAKRGFLTVSDDRGRILGEVRSSAAPFATLLVDVPVVHDWTVYQSLGDWFAWLAMALLLFVLAQSMRLRGRSNTKQD